MTTSTTPRQLGLGEPVRFSTHLKRVGRFQEQGPRGWVKRWEPCPTYEQPSTLDGIVVGRRTLSDGGIDGGNNYDDPITYKGSRYFTAYLVAYALNRAPVFVLPEDLTPTDGIEVSW